jgi:hypothetical protein
MTYRIDDKDLNFIISRSKDNYSSLSLPLFVNRVEIGNNHLPSIAILESTLSFLNSKGLLTKLVTVDYTKEYLDNDTADLEDKK